MSNIKTLRYMRDRAWRRKKTESKWNSRCKRFLFESRIEDGKKVHTYTNDEGIKKVYVVPNFRKPSTWKEMKKDDSLAKYLRDSSTSRSWVSDQLDAKHAKKLQRINAKRQINDGILEWDEIYDEIDEVA